MKDLNDKNFEELVINSPIPFLVDVYTHWCPPCNILGPILEVLSSEYEGKVDFYKMNLDQCPKTGNKFMIDRIPTVMLFANGELKASFIGLREKEEIRNLINSNI
jgi:thioredoxin 1